jgi:hypothetical protein
MKPFESWTIPETEELTSPSLIESTAKEAFSPARRERPFA